MTEELEQSALIERLDRLEAERGIWGLTHPWDPEDPDRPCFTCGHPPTARFTDGSPKYLAHHWDHRGFPVYPPGGWERVQGVRLVHTLSAADLAAATSCATRIVNWAESHARDKWGSMADRPRRLAGTLLGSMGEIAFARLTGLHWRCTVGSGFGKPDVGRYEVRTTGPTLQGLPIHSGDRHPTVLMTKEGPWSFRFRGWLLKPQANLRPEWSWRGYRVDPGWLVPLDALEDPRTLPELAP